MFDEDYRVPERAVLLHIGPHKTGTTAIQGALHTARPQLLEHGAAYAGVARQHQNAALAVTGGGALLGRRTPRRGDWLRLVRDVRSRHDQRVIVSSEFFDGATDEVAGQIVSELGSDRVHVVVTLRPLAKILPSAWQQYVRNGLRLPYERWLDVTLNHMDGRQATPSFWVRHHHDVQVDRWASIVGPDRVLVIAVDDADREFLMRAFERILALPSGLLAAETGWSNRSLTAAEVELILSVNVEFRQREWSPRVYNDMIRDGVVAQMQQRTPPAGEPRVVTPPWAVQRANEIAAAAVARITDSGVRRLGDFSLLSSVAAEAPSSNETSMSVLAVKDAVIDAITASPLVATPTPALDPLPPDRWAKLKAVTPAPARSFLGRVQHAVEEQFLTRTTRR